MRERRNCDISSGLKCILLCACCSTPSSTLSLEEKTPARRGSHDSGTQNQNQNNQQQQQQHQTTTNRQNSLGLPEPPGGHQPRRLSDCGPITQLQSNSNAAAAGSLQG